MSKIQKLIAAGALVMILCPLASATEIIFEARAPEFEPAAAEYRQLWLDEGKRITETLQRLSGLPMEAGPIRSTVYEGPAFSGYKDEMLMRMRASYPADTKKATLVHELSHRLLVDRVSMDFEDHPLIFLFLYDVWCELWGQTFADAQVAIESARRGRYDYEGAWQTALALSAEERAQQWKTFLAAHEIVPDKEQGQ